MAKTGSEPTKPVPPGAAAEPGAPVAKDAIDPELIRLARTPIKVGLLSAAAVVIVCFVFVLRLGPDRRFAGESGTPVEISAAQLATGPFANNSYARVTGEPLVSHAIRVTHNPGTPGLRVAPLRGSNDLVWIVVDGQRITPVNEATTADGTTIYTGRLRRLSDVRFGAAMRRYAVQHPRPVFGTVPNVRAAFASGKLVTLTGETVALADGDRVIAQTVDPGAANVVVSFISKLPDVKTWTEALVAAGIAPAGAAPIATDKLTATFQVTLPNAVAEATTRAANAKLYALRIEPVVREHETTFGALKTSPAGTLALGNGVVTDQQLDVVAIYAIHDIPANAHVLLVGEVPGDYWYILPATILLGLLGLLFIWAFVLTLRRDVLAAPTSARA